MKFRKLLLLCMSNPDAVRAATTKWIFSAPGRTDISRRRITTPPSKDYLKRAQVLIWDGNPKWESIVKTCETAGIEIINVAKPSEPIPSVPTVRKASPSIAKGKRKK